MPNSVEAIYILVVLLPGFLVVTIVELLTGMRSKEVHRFIVYSLALSFAIYAVYSLLVKKFSLPDISVVAKSVTSDEKSPPLQSFMLSVDLVNILVLFVLAIALAVLLSLAINKDWMKILRKFGLTQQSHASYPLDRVFQLKKCWVLVKLCNGDMVQGWPKRMSSNEGKYSMSLLHPFWIRNDAKYVDMDIDEFVITGDIEWVQFLKQKSSAHNTSPRSERKWEE